VIRNVANLLFPVVIIALIVGVLSLSKSMREPSSQSGRDEPPARPTIETTKPTHSQIPHTMTWFGRVESSDIVRVHPQIAGTITAVHADPGARLRKGDPLFSLGGPAYQNRLTELDQSESSVNARLDISRARLDLMSKAYENQLATKDAVLAARDTLATLVARKTEILQARRFLLANREVFAAADGVLVEKDVALGQLVSPGTTLGRIAHRSGFHIRAEVYAPRPEELVGSDVTVFRSGGGEDLRGKVLRVLRQRTRLGAALIWIGGPDLLPHLVLDETVSGLLVRSAGVTHLALPKSAVVRDADEHTFVFIARGSDYRLQEVSLGESSKDTFEILSGVSEDDDVVVTGAYELYFRRFSQDYKVAD